MSACVTRLCFIQAQSCVAPTQSSIEWENPKTSGPGYFVGTRLVGLEFPLRTHRRGQGGRRLQGGGPSRGDRVNQRASVSRGASPNGKRDSPAAEILHADRGQYFGDGLADAATGAGAEVKRLLQVRLRDIGTQSLNRRPMRSMTSRIEPRQRLKQPGVSKSKDIGTLPTLNLTMLRGAERKWSESSSTAVAPKPRTSNRYQVVIADNSWPPTENRNPPPAP